MNHISKLPISVFFPAFNDEKSIGSLVDTAVGVLKKYASEFEVIVVNDGSTDGTAAMLEQLRIRYQPYVRIVTHPENLGYGAALRSGFAAARKKYIFYTDGDGQYDVSELPRLIELMEPDVGLVNGYKLSRHDPWHRVAIGYLYNRFAKGLFGVHICDIDCDFRLIRREALNDADLRSTSGTICVELVRMIELSPWRVRQTGVHHYHRLHGGSQFFRVRSLATTFWQLMLLYLRLAVRPVNPKRERCQGDDSEGNFAPHVAATKPK
jgi:glycosyltransferase involved in cell wall biosynthesis